MDRTSRSIPEQHRPKLGRLLFTKEETAHYLGGWLQKMKGETAHLGGWPKDMEKEVGPNGPNKCMRESNVFVIRIVMILWVLLWEYKKELGFVL
ncbi:hypothetical protein MA16_Dca024441 [Dendrobium catenatum]|uniref:Uncharacterized protein n=1 Tax=Dendrobium catenatum TaxID=906689 RepID=A0A2I0W505_9ASPA|nr:hypothetical protein MA16_Dca024441 [Dendrobium catenatum]